MRPPARFTLLLVLAAAGVTPAGAVDVSHLASVEEDPCFQQVYQRALDNSLGVIESQIAAACTDAHGNPTEAMALLTERAKAPPWLPPASGGMGSTAVLILAVVQLAILASLLGVDAGYAGRALGLTLPAAAVPIIAAGRLLAALVLTALLALPGVTVIAALGLLAFAVRASRWRGPQLAAGPAEPSGRLAGGIGVLATDLIGNLPATLGIALVSRGSLLLTMCGVLAAMGAARLLHPALVRLMLQRPVLPRAAAALVAVVAGLAGLSDPGIAAFGPVPLPLLLAVPALFAVLALAAGHRPSVHVLPGGGAPDVRR